MLTVLTAVWVTPLILAVIVALGGAVVLAVRTAWEGRDDVTDWPAALLVAWLALGGLALVCALGWKFVEWVLR